MPLDRLTRRRELRLTVPAGRAAPDREAVWAHSIELAGPTPGSAAASCS
ncbi:hypothetical protein ACIA74_17545 [Streptomyces sp. NPDC051658]